MLININGSITPIFEKGIIEFNNYDEQLPILFKIYADIECDNKKINWLQLDSNSQPLSS